MTFAAKTCAALCCAALMCVAAFSAEAETVDVTGVAADDVLNLRSEPRAGAPISGALSPTASGIEIVRRPDGWLLVRHGKLEGWAAVTQPRRPSSGSLKVWACRYIFG